ncbi:MAG: hypothetical protein ACQERD_01640 [Campylobacterota bacterium]
MVSKQIKDFAKLFLLLDFCLIIYSLIFESYHWLLNAQVAFVASLIITLGTYYSYKRNISNRLSNMQQTKGEYINDERDKIDEIDDPYDLYSEYEEIPKEDLTPEKIKEILKDEKSKLKKDSLKNTLFSASGFLSIYRLFGYTFLIVGFLALNNNSIFIPMAFLIGLGVVPLGVLASKLIIKA